MLSLDPLDCCTCSFASRSRAASRLKTCSGTNRRINGTRRPEKIATNPNVHLHDLFVNTEHDSESTFYR